MENLKLTYEQGKNLILYLIHCVSWLCPVDCGKENQPGAGCTDSIINLKERSKFGSCQMAKGDASESTSMKNVREKVEMLFWGNTSTFFRYSVWAQINRKKFGANFFLISQSHFLIILIYLSICMYIQ